MHSRVPFRGRFRPVKVLFMRLTAPNSLRLHPRLPLAALAGLTVTLAGCFGGGSNDTTTTPTTPEAPPTVTSATASTAKYSQTLTVTVIGTNLDHDLVLTSTGCGPFVRSTTDPYVSSTTTAYFQCKVNGLGARQVTVGRASTGETFATVPFTVAMPQAALTVDLGNGQIGQIVIDLAADKVPVTVTNFLNYVNSGFYTDTIFHRVSSTTPLVQGGGYAKTVSATDTPTAKATGFPIGLEIDPTLKNTQWTIGMARLGTSTASATSQFYINLADNPGFDPVSGSTDPAQAGYAVFGTVSSGTNVAAAIATVPCVASTVTPAPDCLPVPNVVITAATQTQ